MRSPLSNSPKLGPTSIGLAEYGIHHVGPLLKSIGSRDFTFRATKNTTLDCKETCIHKALPGPGGFRLLFSIGGLVLSSHSLALASWSLAFAAARLSLVGSQFSLITVRLVAEGVVVQVLHEPANLLGWSDRGNVAALLRGSPTHGSSIQVFNVSDHAWTYMTASSSEPSKSIGLPRTAADLE